MKKVKRKLKGVKKKYDKRLKKFWKFNLNPITGRKKPTPRENEEEGVPVHKKSLMRHFTYKSNGHQ